ETIADILTKPVADIQAAAQGVMGAGSGPVLNNVSITRDPFNPDGPPQSADVPLLIGCNRTEGTSLTPADSPNHSLTWETLPAAIKQAFPSKNETALIDLYKAKHPDIEAPELYFMAAADNTFFRGSVTVADRKANQGGAPVFFYM